MPARFHSHHQETNVGFDYSPEQQMLSDALRAFVDREIVPHEELVERTGAVPPDLVRQIRERAIAAGFYALNMPAEYGGGGLSHLDRAVAEFQFGRASRALQMICNRPAPILKACRGAQIETHLKPTIRGERLDCFGLTEPGAGSDARAISTRAVADGDDYVINGTKQFITQADRADFIILFAVTGVDETPRGPRKRITSFLVDKVTRGVTVTPLKCVSNRGLVSTTISLVDVRVPKRDILGEEGAGFNMAKDWIFSGRIMLAANCVGVSERAMELAAGWANQRKAFGRTIGEFQGTAFKFADMAMEIYATRLLVLDAADKLDQGKLTARVASQVNLFGSEMAGRVTDNALQVFGGMGITEDMPLQRFWRDVRVERIWEGTSEIHRDLIARDVLREFPG
jgi:acyl-CoA dehydrogenase